jgi:DNA-3-methyladenine glycosylase
MRGAFHMPLPKILISGFYARPTVAVARDLLGKVLVRGDLRERIVETEAYLGARDRASHARFGPEGRSSVMFGPPGRLYVYLVYGMHHCMNVVTEKEGTAGAVLLRSSENFLGPGRLCRGLGVTRRENRLDLTDEEGGLYLADDGFRPSGIRVSARIGVAYAGPWARRRLRFYYPPKE